MKRLILCLAALGAGARASSDWFTIVGDPADSAADTIQMDPVPKATEGPKRTMSIRVSRSQQRTSTDGIAFRSFEGEVELHCDSRSARFVRSTFYAEPLWKSTGQTKVYPPTEIRPMEFRLFEPNPRDRVVRAACRSYDESRSSGSSAPGKH